ncbi:MAG: Uma2 family endonuclease [Nitrococcus sp.]|nr:Uma2 family endonuclease [Nitrococcus sp.]
MAVVEKVRDLSPQEYLEGELRAEVKREYVAGQVYAMVGVSRAHNIIAGNIFAALRNHLRGGPCQAFIADMKVRAADAFFYPDVAVTRDPADRHEYYLERPALVIEVVSPSTEARDTLDKRIAYQAINSLEDYVLVAQHRAEVRIYRRLEGGWELETCTGTDTVRLNSVGLEIPVATIYEGV